MINTERLFEIHIPIYNEYLMVSYSSNLEFMKSSFKDQPEWSRKRKKMLLDKIKETFKDHPTKTGARYLYHREEGIDYIHIFKQDNIPDLIDKLSHEVLHFVHCLLDRRGFTLTDSSEEAYTYLMGYIMKNIIEEFET